LILHEHDPQWEGRVTIQIQRRGFILSLGGAVIALPLAARAQQPDRPKRIGMLMNLASDDSESNNRLSAFLQALHQLGWIEGRNVRIYARWGAGDVDSFRRYAAELVALAPDVIVAASTPALGPLQSVTRTVPIVFVQVADPVGSGFVESLGRPGGNMTGLAVFEYSICGKWLELLKQVFPGVTRVVVLRKPGTAYGSGQFGAIQTAALPLSVELSQLSVRNTGEIERGLSIFASGSNRGLIVTASTFTAVHREVITTLAALHHLPAVYPFRYFITSGGLMSYGPDSIGPFRQAAGYVDRILKGEKVADLPVQAPTKYELDINLKTAKALGIDVPPTLLATADEVIE
jgi:putative tryptophan/tyrosine transport system substrate-binding protein